MREQKAIESVQECLLRSLLLCVCVCASITASLLQVPLQKPQLLGLQRDSGSLRHEPATPSLAGKLINYSFPVLRTCHCVLCFSCTLGSVQTASPCVFCLLSSSTVPSFSLSLASDSPSNAFFFELHLYLSQTLNEMFIWSFLVTFKLSLQHLMTILY